MARVERRDVKPEQEPEKPKSGISRREFLQMAGTGVAGLVVGGVVGSQVVAQQAPPPPTEAAAPAAPAAAEGEPAAAGEAAVAAVEYKAGHMLVFDPVQCTGCMKCARACAEKWATELHPEETADLVNLEFSRIRPMRFQYVDVVDMCYDCKLLQWAEGSEESPCQAVCPEDAILTIPEGEGVAGSYGMGYKWIDRDKCLGVDKCWRCAEICEEQFGSGISFDPIDKKAQVCSRCGGDPSCVKACPEPMALQFVPIGRNGRFYADQPADMAEMLYRKMYSKRRTL